MKILNQKENMKKKKKNKYEENPEPKKQIWQKS